MDDGALLIDGAAKKVYKYNTCFINLSEQGDHIGWFLANWATFGRSFFRDKVAQGNGYMLGVLLYKTIIYICTYIKSFKTYFVVSILMSKVFWCRCFLIQNCALMSIIRLFWLGSCFGYFLGKLGDFFQIDRSHCISEASTYKLSFNPINKCFCYLLL